MLLNDLASIGSFTSGVAVLISLVFLCFQLRQVNAQVVLAEKNQPLVRQGRTNPADGAGVSRDRAGAAPGLHQRPAIASSALR